MSSLTTAAALSAICAGLWIAGPSATRHTATSPHLAAARLLIETVPHGVTPPSALAMQAEQTAARRIDPPAHEADTSWHRWPTLTDF